MRPEGRFPCSQPTTHHVPVPNCNPTRSHSGQKDDIITGRKIPHNPIQDKKIDSWGQWVQWGRGLGFTKQYVFQLPLCTNDISTGHNKEATSSRAISIRAANWLYFSGRTTAVLCNFMNSLPQWFSSLAGPLLVLFCNSKVFSVSSMWFFSHC